jgi:uncharacterized protein (TIGR04168 family)
MASRPNITKIAVVGDVHDLWETADVEALQHLGVDLVLLVGDFGNESVEVVRSIAAIPIPKAVILGNHDAFYSASDWGRKKCPYDHTLEDRLQQQLDLLGNIHVGYGYLDFPAFELSVVGARPFSWGGSEWKNAEFYQSRYAVADFATSTAKIVDAAKSAAYETIIFLGHNGPLGLGDRPEDICGKDWQPIGGDHGDPDFAAALNQTRQFGKTIPLATFGHMHHTLRHTRDRLRTEVVASPEGTIFLNAARVPRIIQTETDRLRNFSLVQLHQGKVLTASLVWLDEEYAIVSEQILYSIHEPTLKSANFA